MTTLKKTLITATLAVAIGVGVYEVRRAFHLRQEVQDLKEQQALSDLRNEQLQLQREKVSELQKLQEGDRLNSQAQKLNDPTKLAAESGTAKVNLIKQFLEQNPSETIPEIRLVDESVWLSAIDRSAPYSSLATERDYRGVCKILRSNAEEQFGTKIAKALMNFYEVNNGQFPAELSQLQPHCDPEVEKILIGHYKIAPAKIAEDVPTTKATGFSRGNDARVIGDWVITRKVRVNANSTSRLAIFTGGSTWWQSPPGSDDQ